MGFSARIRLFSVLFSLALVILVTGCSGTTPVTPNQLSPVDIQQAITSAEQLNPADRQVRFIELSQTLYDLGDIPTAIGLWERINSDSLGDEDYLKYAVIGSTLYTENQSLFRAYDLLTQERLKQLWVSLPQEQQRLLQKHRAITYYQLGNYQAAIDERLALETLLTDSLDITENHEGLWAALNQLSLEELSQLAQTHPDPIAKGWYQLAVVSKNHEANLVAKQQAVSQWVVANPTHPASLELPLDLQILTSLIEQRPQHIAMLLPLTGKLATAGTAIQQGFLAAYYQQTQTEKPVIRFYDTNQQPVNALYDQALQAGADLVIGPLEKEKVSELRLRQPLPVATLALNYVSESNQESVDTLTPATATGLYQFGLSLEDEAVQAADRAWLEGHRYSMVMASDADWSQRAANAFIQRWQSYGGVVVVNSPFNQNSNFSDNIENALDIDDSQNRARALKRLFGKQFEFEPRRRQDIDMIFLVSRSSEGQQIKPTLAFHYAGDIPVYATSQIVNGNQQSGNIRDLNGIRFTTLPWILNDDNSEKQLIKRHLPMPANYERLYAMGVDTFLLHDRLQQLQKLPNTSLHGSTGKLRLDNQQRIIREQPWAQIIKGEIKPLPILTENNASVE